MYGKEGIYDWIGERKILVLNWKNVYELKDLLMDMWSRGTYISELI